MPTINGSDVKQLIIACDAGMGSSAMVASTLRSKLSSHGINVVHVSVDQLTDAEATVVLTHRGLSERAKMTAPTAVIVPFDMFLGDPAFTKVEQAIVNGTDLES